MTRPWTSFIRYSPGAVGNCRTLSAGLVDECDAESAMIHTDPETRNTSSSGGSGFLKIRHLFFEPFRAERGRGEVSPQCPLIDQLTIRSTEVHRQLLVLGLPLLSHRETVQPVAVE